MVRVRVSDRSSWNTQVGYPAILRRNHDLYLLFSPSQLAGGGLSPPPATVRRLMRGGLEVFGRALLTVGILLTLGLVACGGSTSNPSPPGVSVGTAGVSLGTATVKISATGQLMFDPAMQTAHVGDIVQWTNTGSVEHTITFDAQPSLSDPALQPGATWEVKFTTAGTYQYHCSIHSGMVGTIVVT